MKQIYLFSTRLRALWVQLPVIAVLVLSIIYNNETAGVLRLYPLIIASILGIIFIFIYFARFIRLSYSEIRCVGPFTSRDKAIIKKNRTLILRMLPFGKVKVYLRGYDGPCDFSWLKEDDVPSSGEELTYEQMQSKDICLFRARAFGGRRAAAKVLKYYGADINDIPNILKDEGLQLKYEFVTVRTVTVDDAHQIHITMDETV